MTLRHTHDVRAGPATVYPPGEDTWLLEETAAREARGRTLEIGTGSGRVAVAAALSGAGVVATDLNPAALRAARALAAQRGTRLELVRTDLAAGLGRFDVILANPPYLPTRPGERDPDPYVELALDGGPDGSEVWARIVTTAPDHLAPGGALYLIESSRMDPGRRERVRADWEQGGGRTEVLRARRLEGERLEVRRWTRGGPP